MYGCFIAAPTWTHSRASLRRHLEKAFRTDAELDAFCLDYFAGTHRLFAQGMTRQQKLNLLLEREDLHGIAVQLVTATEPDMAMGLVPVDVGNDRSSLVLSTASTLNRRSRFLLCLISGAFVLFFLSIEVTVHSLRSRSLQKIEATNATRTLRSNPEAAEVWDMHSGKLLGTTPLIIDTSLLQSNVCLRHPGAHDEVISLTEGQRWQEVVALRPVGSSPMEACDVPIQIWQ